jgi:hypothetical protein
VHGFRPDYQDEVNFVILATSRSSVRSRLTWLRRAIRRPVGSRRTPDGATDRRFDPFNNEHMKILLDELVATYGN